MKRSPLSTVVFGLVILGLSLAVQPALAQQSDALDRDMARLQTHMKEMRAEMTAIESETDPAKRQRLLRDHMQGMHEAMSLMRREMMPAMKREQMSAHRRMLDAGDRP